MVCFNTVVLLLSIAHMRAVLSDPGTVPLPQSRVDFSDIHCAESGTLPLKNLNNLVTVVIFLGFKNVDWTVCTRCETFRPPRAHHCRICQRCIRRMDHHCPWINNCVGERNQKYFIQFLIYVGALSAYAVTLVVMSWLTECVGCNQEIHIKQARM